MRKRFLAAVLLTVCAHATDITPAAERLLEKHLKARGGIHAYKELKVRRTVATVKLGAQEVKTTTLESLADGKSYQVLEGPAIGKAEVGFNGQQVWQRSSQGNGLLPPDDMAARAIRRSSRAAEFWDYRNDDRRFNYGGREKRDGVDYEVLETTFTLVSGKDAPAKYYFDSAGLLRVIVAGDDGGTRLEFSDFRAIDGIQYPFKTLFTNSEGKVETIVADIKHNVPFDSAVFEFK